MQAVSSTILFDYVPRFSKDIHSSEGIEDMKASTLNFMRDLAGLLFQGEKIILNDPDDSAIQEESKLDFVSDIKEEAERFNDAVEQVLDHFNHEIE